MKKTWLGILWLGCSALGWAQNWGPPQLPVSTQMYMEYQPKLVLNDGPSLGERIRRSPLFRVFAKAVKLDPNKVDELATFPYLDGRFLFALVRQGQDSPFEALYQAEKKRTRVHDLRFAAEQAFEGINLYRKFEKKFPKTLEDLSGHDYFDKDYLPDGATVELHRDGKKMSVVVKSGDLQVLWPDNSPRSDFRLAEMGGLVLGLGCPDSTALRSFLGKWDAELDELSAEGDHWKFTLNDQSLYLYLPKGWVIFASHPELAAPFLQGPAPAQSLLTNSRFSTQWKRLHRADTEGWMFVDVQDILSTSPGLCESVSMQPDRILVRSLALTSGAHLDGQGQIEVQSRGFLQWDGVQNVTLGPPQAVTLADKIPSDIETVYWLDSPGWVRVSDRLGGEFPGLQEGFSGLWMVAEKRLGFEVPREALAAGAQLYLYGEVIDSYANELEMVIQLVQGYMGSEEPDIQEALAFSGSRLPLLGVLEIANSDVAKKVQDRLKQRLGSQPQSKTVEGVGYSLSEDGRCAWTASNTTQFWANGYTERQLPRVRKAYEGTPANLGATPAYRWFQQERQGELLCYVHTKVDREYSLIKGFLLYLGTDFRPEAEKLGRLRDMHTAIEVVPGGISLRTAIYSEGVPVPPVAQPEENED